MILVNCIGAGALVLAYLVAAFEGKIRSPGIVAAAFEGKIRSRQRSIH